jgi:hypothetical protein
VNFSGVEPDGRARARDAGSALKHPCCTLTRVYLCRHPVDFRKSIDGLSALVDQELELGTFDSALDMIVSRQKDNLKALYWHRNGFCRARRRSSRSRVREAEPCGAL